MISSLVLSSAINVMVIDTGYTYQPDIKHRVVFEPDKEKTLHGSVVVRTMLTSEYEVCPQVRVFLCGYSDKFPEPLVVQCLKEAKELGVRFINMSFSGAPKPNMSEHTAIKDLASLGTKFTVSSGNQSLNLDTVDVYPQSYSKTVKGMYVIGAFDVSKANRGSWVISNYSGKVKYQDREHVGTSYAAPRYMAKLLNEECRKRGYLESN